MLCPEADEGTFFAESLLVSCDLDGVVDLVFPLAIIKN